MFLKKAQHPFLSYQPQLLRELLIFNSLFEPHITEEQPSYISSSMDAVTKCWRILEK
jgi:hypothetical protein